MKHVAWALVSLLGLAACSSGSILTRADNARLNASFACWSFALVFPRTREKKITFTSQQRADQVSQAMVGRARQAAVEDKKWDAELRVVAALAGSLPHGKAAVAAAVANVRKVCDPLLNTANGVSP